MRKTFRLPRRESSCGSPRTRSDPDSASTLDFASLDLRLLRAAAIKYHSIGNTKLNRLRKTRLSERTRHNPWLEGGGSWSSFTCLWAIRGAHCRPQLYFICIKCDPQCLPWSEEEKGVLNVITHLLIPALDNSRGVGSVDGRIMKCQRAINSISLTID